MLPCSYIPTYTKKFSNQRLIKNIRKLRILKKFDFKLALFLEKMRHFLRNMASYSFKQLLLYVKDFPACLLHVSQAGIGWKQAE